MGRKVSFDDEYHRVQREKMREHRKKKVFKVTIDATPIHGEIFVNGISQGTAPAKVIFEEDVHGNIKLKDRKKRMVEVIEKIIAEDVNKNGCTTK